MKASKDKTWLKKQKYGQGCKRVFRQQTKMSNDQWTTPIYINYNYSKTGNRGKNDSWERIPTRQLKIGNPKDYLGYAGCHARDKHNHWLNRR